MTSSATGRPPEEASPPARGESQPPRGLPSSAQRWLSIVGGLVLFGVVLSRVSMGDLTDAFSRARLGQLAAALVLALLTTVLRTLRFSAIYPPGNRWLDAYGLFALLRLISYVLPLRSGEIVSLGLLKQRGLAPTMVETSAAWFLIRLSDLLALGLLLLLAVTLHSSGDDARWDVVGRAVTAALAIALVGGGLLFGGWRRLGPRVAGDGSGWLARRARAFDKGVALVSSPGLIALTLLISLLVWSSQLATGVVALRAFEYEIPVADCVLAVSLAMTINLLPIRAPLGLGTADAIWSAALVLVGVPLGFAVVLALAIRLVQMAAVTLDGTIGFLLSLRSSAQQAA